MVDSSKISKFYEKPMVERIDYIVKQFNLSGKERSLLEGKIDEKLTRSLDNMIENVIGTLHLPLGIATNFIINGKERLITMAIEEPSVVAAASNSARMTRKHGGFTCEPVRSYMIGQVQLLDIPEFKNAKRDIIGNTERILSLANDQDPILVNMGGGAKKIEVMEIETNLGKMMDFHLVVDCLDAMGANAVNTMVEAIAPLLEEISGGRSLLRIISNLSTHRVAKCKATFDKELLGGENVVDAILEAVEFANNDIYRAATHNKGIMNGVSAVVLATGNDTRAIEAGAHSYAALKESYRPLTRYSKDEEGNLTGEIEIPMAVGVIGGATKTNPVARLSLKIMEIENAETLSQVIAAVGLAQNLAALRALVSEGIQEGHMKLHAKNVAKMAKIPEEYADTVVQKMIEKGKVRIDIAKEIYEEVKKK
ncbi:MAG: hydroxymethylglutaryl-CoA reductase, degradative [Candidatus Hodarchaeota archaeon]